MDEMNIPLQEWITANHPKEKMIWKESWSKQVCFVRDEIPRFLSDNYDSYKTISENITVISTHTSKSISLPVYCIKANGDKFILRNNFHDWKVSVETYNMHKIDFGSLGLFNIESQVHQVYCEGFKPEWVYKPYADDKFKYTLEINNDFDLKLFFWLIQKSKILKEELWID
jgi:hypothetical protein